MTGIPVQITLSGEPEASRGDSLRAARERIRELERLLIEEPEEGPVARLNRSAGGDGADPGPEILRILEEAFRLHRMTGGAFDPTVRPLISLWRRGEERQEPPGSREIRETLALVGLEQVRWDRDRGVVALPKAGMGIDLGGVAKGYIVDRVVELLLEAGATRGIVNAGGDLRVFGPEDGEPFRIAIRDPDGGPSDILGTLSLRRGALGTSGNYERFLEIDGRRWGHILDPRDGRPAGEMVSVTVRAPTASLADGLATGLFVLGPARGRDLVESLPEVEAVLLYRDRAGLQRWVSPGMEGARWVRPSALAGRWYGSDREVLRADLRQYVDRVDREGAAGRPVALIAPHAAHRYSGQAAAFGYRAVRDRGFRRTIVLGVSHFVGFHGASIPRVSHYETPLGLVPVDADACDALLRQPLFQTVEAAHRREHSIEIQLPFLQEILGDFSLVPVLLGRLDRSEYSRVAEAVGSFLDERTLLVASSDFTHYGPQFGFLPFQDRIAANLRRLDFGAIEPVLRLDPEGFLDYCGHTGITVCGRVPIGVLLHLLAPRKPRGELLCYYTSGEMGKEFRNSVSYADILYTEDPKGKSSPPAGSLAAGDFAPPHPRFLSPEGRLRMLAEARRALERFVREGVDVSGDVEGEIPDFEGFSHPRGCFVTLTRRGELRGCLGSLRSDRPLYRSVLYHAVQAAARDPRFPPVGSGELEDIEIGISVLGTPTPVDSPDRILLGWHGIVLQRGDRQGVFLPEVASRFGWSREETLEHLCVKSGLARQAWREGARLMVFETQAFSESDRTAPEAD